MFFPSGADITICYQYACIFFMLAVDLKTEGETCYEEKHLRCVLTPPFIRLRQSTHLFTAELNSFT